MSDLGLLSQMFGGESQDEVRDIYKAYPNPNFERTPFILLNGDYDFIATKNKKIPHKYSKKISVPYVIESELSNINIKPKKKIFYHYHKEFDLDATFIKDKVILNIDRISGHFVIFINGNEIYENENEFNLKIDIKDYIKDGTNTIDFAFTLVKKCYLGLSGSVYLNSYYKDEIRKVNINVNHELKIVSFNIDSNISSGHIKVISPNSIIDETTYENNHIDIELRDNVFFSPEKPFFYQYSIKTEGDQIDGTFIYAKFSLDSYKKIPVFKINDEPYPIKGILYNSEYDKGILAPFSYDDIDKLFYEVKKLGFNSILVENKIELPYFYYSAIGKGVLIANKIKYFDDNKFIKEIDYLNSFCSNFILIVENKNRKVENRYVYSLIKASSSNVLAVVYNSKQSFGDFEALKNVNELIKISKNKNKHYLLINQLYKKDSKEKFIEFIKDRYAKLSMKGLIGFYYSSLNNEKDGLLTKDFKKLKNGTKKISDIMNM